MGVLYEKRYQRTKHSEDLKKWINATKEAERLLPADDGNLGNGTFTTQFRTVLTLLASLSQYKGSRNNREQLDTIIQTVAREIADGPAASDDHSFRTELKALKARLVNLRFSRTAKAADLEEIVNLLIQSVESDGDHSDRLARLNSLGIALHLKTDYLRTSGATTEQILPEIDLAVIALRECMIMTPDQHISRAPRLARFCNAVVNRFKWTRVDTDLRDGITAITEALRLAAPDHPRKEILISILNHTSFDRSDLLGGPGIDTTLDACREAFEIVAWNAFDVSEDWPIRPNLTRSEKRRRSGEDIADVIRTLQVTLDALRPSDDVMTKSLGQVLGYSGSDPSYPQSDDEQTWSPTQYTYYRPRRIIGTTGIANMGISIHISRTHQLNCRKYVLHEFCVAMHRPLRTADRILSKRAMESGSQ
jgi:hypothetical protein